MFSWLWKKNSPSNDHTTTPVVIYHHIAKTGGTSLRKVVQANYKGKALLEWYGPNRGSVDWWKVHYHALSPQRKAAIQCIAAHSSHYLIPVIDRPFRVFTLLRNPIDRVISLYYFTRILAQKGKGKGAEIGRLLISLNWSLGDIYRHAIRDDIDPQWHSLLAPFFNGQTRAILGPHTDTSAIPFLPKTSGSLDKTLQHAYQILEAYYEIGITEAYADSLRYFANVFGWEKIFVEHANRTQKRPRIHEISPEVITLIREFNHLDFKLHNYAKNYLSQRLPGGLKEIEG